MAHYKAQLRKLHTKLLSTTKKGDDGESDPLLEQLSSTNLPRWSLALLGKPQKEGWLVKKGGVGGALTKRWFVLSGPLLFYFSNDTDEARAKGVVPLTGADVVAYEVPEKEQLKYEKKAAKGGFQLGQCWAVKTRVREFVISSESDTERAEWMEACSKNSTVALEDEAGDPKWSRAMLQKLLLPPDQLRAEIDAMQSGEELPSEPREELAHSSVAESSEVSRRPTFVGGTVGGWRYDGKDGSLKTFDLKTSGAWPFVMDEPGLFINCKYSWDGEMLLAEEGSGSKGEWDKDENSFTWSCLPLGSFRDVYTYKWYEEDQSWRPIAAELGEELPVWTCEPNKISCSRSGEHYRDLEVEGSLPPQILLAVALHEWSWFAEGEITLLSDSEVQEDEI